MRRCLDAGWYHGGRIAEGDFDYGHEGEGKWESKYDDDHGEEGKSAAAGEDEDGEEWACLPGMGQEEEDTLLVRAMEFTNSDDFKGEMNRFVAANVRGAVSTH